MDKKKKSAKSCFVSFFLLEEKNGDGPLFGLLYLEKHSINIGTHIHDGTSMTISKSTERKLSS